MSRSSLALALTVVISSVVALPRATVAAPAPPNGAHPRIFLGAPAVKDAFKAAAAKPGTAAAALVAQCQAATTQPSNISASGYQGDNWSFTASACALSWQMTGNTEHAATALKLWRALLEDVVTLGDKKACVAGAVAPAAIAAIVRDAGYAIRFIGPHTALVYDWMHDAPGVTEALRQQTRDCFRAWVTYYTQQGYLNTEPGANYHAGYVAAKTLIAIAEAGEDGTAGDTIWTQAVDDVLTKQLLGNGMATSNGGIPKGSFNGALVGGDWPEGWQYGPLSVIEYAAASRALREQGIDIGAMGQWASDLTLRHVYGLLPDKSGMYVGGDTESEAFFSSPSGSPLDATLLGPSSDQAAGWAAFLNQQLFGAGVRKTLWQALADTRAVTAVDPTPTAATPGLPPWFLARGPRNLYARSAWTTTAFWSVLTSAPRVVDDHQHMDASSFVFVRGGDSLIVDPSPYASRSSLTSNALTLESNVVVGDYKPSQTSWSGADMPLARGTASGVVAARADFANAFNFSSTASDIKLARRDWVFLPEGEIVTIDHMRTPSATAKAYLRFRTPAALTVVQASPLIARGDVGVSSLAIHAVKLTPATAPLLRQPVTAGDCGAAAGGCAVARNNVWEYAWEVPGPEVVAVHAIDGLAQGEIAADVAAIDATPIDTTPAENAAVVGASVFRAQKQTFVLEPAAVPGPATLTYSVPGGNPSRHVVFDAPSDSTGRTTVTATVRGGRCAVTLTAGAGVTGVPAIFTLSTAASGCTVSEDANVAAGTVSPGMGGFGQLPGVDGGTSGVGGSTGAGGKGGGGTNGTAGSQGSGGTNGAGGTNGTAGKNGTGGNKGTGVSNVTGDSRNGTGSSPDSGVAEGSGAGVSSCSIGPGVGAGAGGGPLAAIAIVMVSVARRRRRGPGAK